eukprot:gene4681-5291_t
MLLYDILRSFGSQLSQEQTWAVCYMTTKLLSVKRRENLLQRRNMKYSLSIESVEIDSSGHVALIGEEELLAAGRQKESEIIESIGNLLCRCLDYGLDVSSIDSVKFEPDMAELIAGMVLQHFDEQDEGYNEDEDDENFDNPSTRRQSKNRAASVRYFRNFDEIIRFCHARLLRKNIDTGGEHYRNVLRALYVESHELKVFLDQVTHSLDKASNEYESHHKLNPGAAITAQECVYEWARFWLQVMHELRRGVHLRKVAQTKVSPLEYEYTPFEIAKNGASVSSGANLRPTEQSGLPENAKDIILNFILSRPVSEKAISAETDVQGGGVGVEKARENETGDLVDENDNASQLSNHRKQLKVQTPLLAKIENWDLSLESLLSEDDPDQAEAGVRGDCADGSFAAHGSLHDNATGIYRRCHSANDAEPQQSDYEAVKPNPTPVNAKKRLAVSPVCFIDIPLQEEDPRVRGTSLFEMSQIRQAIALAEVDSLAPKTTKSEQVKYGKICFSCQRTKFSIFNKARQCEICRKKFCTKCSLSNIEVPDHLIDTNEDLECDTSQPRIHKSFSKSLGNLTSLDGDHVITPFPCKRQSLLQLGQKHTFGVRLVNMCKECKTFMDSILIETKNTRWHVGHTIDI